MIATVDQAAADPQQIIAELGRQLDEALAQQAATAEVLEVINSSPGDLAPVFQVILEKAHALCGVESGGLVLFDGDHFRLVANHAMPERHAESVRRPYRATPGSAQDRLLRGERFVQIEDVRVNPTSPQNLSSIEAGTRTLLQVPLRKDGALLGFITSIRREVRPFLDKEITLLENFAAQAVIAMENARLITETREALDQQTATAEVLQVINSSPGDLAPVFEAMLEKALRLCESAFGALSSYDGKEFQTVAMHGVPPALAESWTVEREPDSGGSLPRLVNGELLVRIEDMRATEAYRSGSPRRRAIVDLGGARSYIAVPLRKDGAMLGAIRIYRQEVRPFSDKQIALLQNFAAQAVIAMENARLLNETREALEQQTATAEVLQVINSSPGDLAPVFEAMLDKAHFLCGAELGTLFLYDGEKIRAAATHGYPEDVAEMLRQGIGAPPPLLAGARLIHRPDISQGQEDAVTRVVSERGGVRTNLLVPLRKEGAFLGMISCNRREVRPYTDREIALIENFAAQAVIAIENARLITETREALEQQTATAEVLGVGPPAASPIAKTRRLLARSLASTVMPCAVAAIPAAGKSSAARFGWRPAAISRCEPVTRSPLSSRTVTAAPLRSIAAIGDFGCSTMPSSPSRSTSCATNSGSSRGSSGPASMTVTSAPSRRCACASSIPIAPPPMMIKCRGNSRLSNTVSLVRKGAWARPGISGTIGDEPVAITKRRARISLPFACTRRGPVNLASP
jgi:GAF domain-containing protein